MAQSIQDFAAIAIVVVIVILIWMYFAGDNSKITKIILFYRPSCGYCEMFKPEWEILQRKYPTKTIAYNTEEEGNKKIAEEYNIESVPTIYLINEKGTRTKYVGPRTAAEIINRYNSRLV
jgi:thiol-disulfide isomerase/thioredoxin